MQHAISLGIGNTQEKWNWWGGGGGEGNKVHYGGRASGE